MADFKLTRPHVLKAFEPLQETDDIARRNSFFSESIVPDVKWTITGQAHSLVGTRNSIQEHSNMSFDKIDKRLEGPIKFVVTKVINVWLTRFNDQGKIVEVRSYFDTLLEEMVLAEPADGD
ncbi:hypothetical protein EDB80DRAFT_891134 [Ilyonectria destructans]|nr:hypothetical protein EDB80DRAFT_891134 [Ilyonectria destructans]